MARKYIVTEISTGKQYVGTAEDLSKKLKIGLKTVSRLANGKMTHTKYTSEAIIDESEGKKSVIGTELDRYLALGREHGMSYGQIVGVTDTLKIPIGEFEKRNGDK